MLSPGPHRGAHSLARQLRKRQSAMVQGPCIPKQKTSDNADLVEVMRGSGQGLMQQVASLTVAAQVSRTSQTVGTRFREQLKDLITRLDQYAPLPLPLFALPPYPCPAYPCPACLPLPCSCPA